MGGIFTNIWPFASELFDLKEKLTSAKRERREAVALYCEKIADTADEMLSLLQQNKIPAGPWAKMEVYRIQMPEIVRGLIPEDNITGLAYWFDTRLTAPEFLNDFNNPMYREGITSELSSSAGTLRALAESLRAKR